MPRGSRASRSWREWSSQSANANIPRSIATASVPRSASRRSMTAVSPRRLERFAGLLEVAPQILEVVDLAVEDDRPCGRPCRRSSAGRRRIVQSIYRGQRSAACTRRRRDPGRSPRMPAHADPMFARASVIRCRAVLFRPLIFCRVCLLFHTYERAPASAPS